jgi:hypothetical protein
MDQSYEDMIRASDNFKKQKSDKFKEVSKDRLLKISKKKVKTTMIGALSTVEEKFGFLWGHKQEDPLTPEQEHMKELYEEARSEILDRGNNQARNLEAEFANYEINWLRYTITLPVRPIQQQEGEENAGETQG